jgi:putative phage-type endonuclease
MKRTPSPVPGSPDWIEQRRHGIFATDAATVTGRSPFSSPFDKFAELQGTSMPKVATEAMEMGTILQPVVGKLWADKHNRKVRACPWTYWLEPGIGSHYDFDVVTPSPVPGSPDWIEQRRHGKCQPVTELLEVKTASAYAQRDWGEEETAEIPEAYLLQVQHEIMCRPLIQRCYVAVLIGGQKLRSYVVERDDGMIEDLLKIERKFLVDSRAGIAPPMDGSEAATAYLRGLSPRDNGERWELPESVENLATAYLAASASMKSAEEQKASAANLLRAAMGDNAAGIGKSVKVSYKNGKDSDWVDWRAVVLTSSISADAIARQTSTRSGTRPLIVSLIGD